MSAVRHDRDVLSYARAVRAYSRRTREAAAATRLRSRAVHAESRVAVARAEQIANACPYARIVGICNRERLQIIVRRDGTTVGGGRQLDTDPLKAALAAARACDHVTSVSIRMAGWRTGGSPVAAAARIGPERDARDTSGDATRRQIAESLNETVIRQLFAVGLTATSLQQRTQDPALRDGLGNIVSWLDDVIRQLRSAVFDLGPVPDAPGPAQSAAFDRIVARLAILGTTAVSLQHQTADPFVRNQLIRFVAALDQSAAELRGLTGMEAPRVPGGYDVPPAAV